MVEFFVGLHQPSDAHRFVAACISINRLRSRKKPLGNVRVLVDSGAFTELNLYGRYRHDVVEYASELHRLWTQGVVNIVAAVAQDFMCEDFMLARTEATNVAIGTGYGPVPKLALVAIHQRWTIERYDALVAALDRLFEGACPFPILPVLQGYSPADYARHLNAYGDQLKHGMWVGVGSICKRNGDPSAIVAVLSAIKLVRPDLCLHGFGVKTTSLLNSIVRRLLATADSMGWSFAARKQGRDANDWREAERFVATINNAIALPAQLYQTDLFEAAA